MVKRIEDDIDKELNWIFASAVFASIGIGLAIYFFIAQNPLALNPQAISVAFWTAFAFLWTCIFFLLTSVVSR